MISFKHSGDAGDIIYSLPVVKALAIGGAAYYLSRETFTRVRISRPLVENFRELLMAQPYIKKVELYTGQAVCYDLDGFRKLLTSAPMAQQHSLMQYHTRWFGLHDVVTEAPWLTVPPLRIAPVVINRSKRYRNEHFPWDKVYAKYRDKAVFVGRADEHRDFCSCVGPIPHYATVSLFELAQVISGADLFIGNQSAPWSIAEGLKKPGIIETALWLHTAANPRPDVQYVVGERIPNL